MASTQTALLLAELDSDKSVCSQRRMSPDRGSGRRDLALDKSVRFKLPDSQVKIERLYPSPGASQTTSGHDQRLLEKSGFCHPSEPVSCGVYFFLLSWFKEKSSCGEFNVPTGIQHSTVRNL